MVETDDMRFLTVPEVADRLRVAESTLRNWAYRRRIPSQKVNGRLVFSPAALRAWLRLQARPIPEQRESPYS
jgi:excisionase family DNA binding protein